MWSHAMVACAALSKIDVVRHTWRLTMPMPAMEAMFMRMRSWGSLHATAAFCILRMMYWEAAQ